MSSLTKQIATQLRGVYFGGNWTWVNFKENIADISWEEATRKVGSLNTIAQLLFHTGYYISAQIKVFNGGDLDAKDELSFIHPPIKSEEDWQSLISSTYENAEQYAALIEELPESRLWETFVNEKYGNYYRNIHGVIEHLHYHLGQIVLLKKMIRSGH